MQNRDIAPFIQRGPDLMVSVSGVRGRIPEGLDPVNITEFLRAFCAVTGKKIVIGNDARPTGPILRHLARGVMLAAGKEILDIGLAPTPTVKAAVRTHKAHAGIMFSASHNPPEWNAFKFMGKEGYFFGQDSMDALLDAMRKDAYVAVPYKKMGTYREVDGIQDHIKSVLALITNKKEIRAKKYTVVVDGVGGAGREALPRLLEELGCKVIRLFCEATPRGEFPRPPEPTPSALGKFGKLVKTKKAAIGFALDPDADRLVTAGPARGAIHEEYTLPLALLGTEEYRKARAAADAGRRIRGQKPIVVNLSTAGLIGQVAERVGIPLLRSPVGEANVVEKMRSSRAFFGGEGNGGVIHPLVPSYGRDTLSGAALILSAMARGEHRTVESLMDEMPPLFMEKTKVRLQDTSRDEILEGLLREFPDAETNTEDGLRLTLPDNAWLHVRASNTEPILRIIAQAPSRKALKDILDRAVSP